ncbi:MAG TPA: nucleotidyltransferase substrate binding protein, partial [Acetobacteraceae bacterium]
MTDRTTRLDISALIKATARVREGLERHLRVPQDEQVRDGLIQRFEYTYELCHRMRRRYLQDLIRTGDEQGLLRGDWPLWRRFRDMRARTSHTYSAAVAEQVVAGIPEFLEETTHLVEQPRQR